MTDTYTIEQIAAAWRKIDDCKIDHINRSELIAELTRIQWKPQVGEVCFDDIDGVFFPAVGNDQGELRPLTPDEVPALAWAISELEAIATPPSDLGQCRETASAALDKITELTQSNGVE